MSLCLPALLLACESSRSPADGGRPTDVGADLPAADADFSCNGKHVRIRYEVFNATSEAVTIPRSLDAMVAGRVYTQSNGGITSYGFQLDIPPGPPAGCPNGLQLATSGEPEGPGRYRATGYFSGASATYCLRWQAIENSTIVLTKVAGSELEAEFTLSFKDNANPEFTGAVYGSFELRGSVRTSCFPTEPPN